MDKTHRDQWTWLDDAIVWWHQQCLSSRPPQRPSPAEPIADSDLTIQERYHVCGLMRVNHTGEVCAQALYCGHAWGVSDPKLRTYMLRSADEEYDHLSWCRQRLQALSGRGSCLQPFWYLSSLAMGYAVARCGDDWALGFIAETERQVEAHLSDHLERLPDHDHQSRAILEQMKQDEHHHGQQAWQQGGRVLPSPWPQVMRGVSRVMVKLAYWI